MQQDVTLLASPGSRPRRDKTPCQGGVVGTTHSWLGERPLSFSGLGILLQEEGDPGLI